jgi:5,10-methylenetetrahydromethanopterin reductase
VSTDIEFQVCVLPPADPRIARALASHAEDLRFDRFWVSDQTFHADPFVLLTDLADRTRIPLGLAVTNPYARHPAQLARAMATLAQLHPERDWIFGLGTANPQHVLAPLSLSARNGPRHIRVAIETIRRLTAGETVTVSDPELDFALESVSLTIDAPSRFGLYVGTRGPQMLEHAAGRVADGVLVEGQLTRGGIEWARELLDAGSRRGGREQFERPYVSWQLAQVLEEGDSIPGHATDFAAMLIASTADPTLERMDVSVELAHRLKSGSLTASDVPRHVVAKFVAAGTAAKLCELVDMARDAGAAAWAAVFTGSPKDAARAMTEFAHGVMTPLRG